MSCSNIETTFSVSPATTGFSYTIFTIQGSVSSSDPLWAAANKNITYNTYGGADNASTKYRGGVTSTDFFSTTNLGRYNNIYNVVYNPVLRAASNYVTGVVTVSSDYLVCSSTSSISSISILATPTLTANLSGDHLVYLYEYSYNISPSSNIVLNISSFNNVNSIPLVARIQVPGSNTVSSFYTPTSVYFPITGFGLTYAYITAVPLITAEDLSLNTYLNQAVSLGFTTSAAGIIQLEFLNRAYNVTTNLRAYPRYAPTLETNIGYAPSIYSGNTGTSFEISGAADFTNFTTRPVGTSINLSYIGTLGNTNSVVFDTITALADIYQYTSNSVNPGVIIPLSIAAKITGPADIPAITNTTASITLVDPPIISFNIESSESYQQEQNIVVSNDVTFNIEIIAALPYIYVFKNGVDSTETVGSASSSISISIFDEGASYTAYITAYPLLSATTDMSYITSDTRTLHTGINPIVLNKTFILNKQDAVIPADNIYINYAGSAIKYNNENIASFSSSNVSSITAFRYINQFNQTVVPNLSVSALIGSGSTYTIDQLKNRINDKDIFITLSFNNITATNLFNLYSLLTSANLQTPAPPAGSVTVTARPKDTFNITTKTIPYSGITFDFVTPAIYFSKFTPSWYASYINPYAFEVTVWNDTEQTIDTIQTYVDGSNSYPYDTNLTRYSRLVPQWWFQDVNGNKSETYTVNNTKLYNTYDGTYIGTSGTAVFYFKDDSPTGPNGELLVVSPIVSGVIVDSDILDNVTERPGYANSLQRATQLYYVNNLHPSRLNITRDGIRDLKKYYWYTNPIPNTLTIDTGQQLNEKYGVDFSYPYDNNNHPFSIGISGNNVNQIVLSPETTNDLFTVTYYNTSFNATNEQGIISTGFVRDSLTPTLSTGTYRLIASTTVHPSGQYAHTPFAWVCDDKNNLITKLFYENGVNNSPYSDCIKNLIQQQYLKVPVSGVNNMLYRDSSLDTMSLTGISEATNVAIDGLYNVWVTDGGNDVVYKINNNGVIEKTIHFPSGSTPGAVCVDSEQNVWITLVDDISALKYSTDGELLTTIISPATSSEFEDNPYKPAGIDVDINDNVWITFYNSVCSVIQKYTSDGNFINSVALPPYYSPVDIIVDGQDLNTAWVLTEHASVSSNYYVGAIHKITNNTTQVLLSGFNTPTHFNIDANRNLWLVLGSTFILKYNIDSTEWKTYDLASILNETENNIAPLDNLTYSKKAGIDWVQIPSTLNIIYDFAYGNGKFVAVGSGRITTSNDFYNWSPYIIDTTINTGQWTSVVYANDKFVAVSEDYKGGIYSTNGETWQSNTLPASRWYRIRYINDQFIAIGSSTSTGQASIAASPDGINWTTKSVLGGFYDVAYGNGVYVVLGYSGTYISPDLDNWTYYNTLPGFSGSGYIVKPTILFVNDMFVVQGTFTGNNMFISTDGINWSVTSTTNIYSSLAYGDGKFVATTGAVLTRNHFYSYDAYTWNISNSLSNIVGSLSVVKFINGKFYAMGVGPRPRYNGISENVTTENIYKTAIDQLLTYTDINGIAGHSDGTIYLISSKRNKVYILQVSDNNLYLKQTFNIYPTKSLNSSYNDLSNITDWSNYSVVTTPYFYDVQDVNWEIGVQAHGDWTGLRRTLKYCPVTTNTSYIISGSSEPFDIKTSPPEIRVLNDSYNLANALSLVFPEFLNAESVPVLHNEFLPGSVGTDASSYQTIGRQYFEKIANFTRNHNDIDFCNVSQLYSIAAMLGVTLDDYNLEYPSDILKALNTLSIQHKRLFGDVDNFNRRFNPQIFAVPSDNIESIQAKLNYDVATLPANTMLTAGTPLVVHDLTYNTFNLLYINADTQLKYLSGYGLRYPVYNFDADTFNQYKFHAYKSNESPTMVNSFIDWNSTHTTVVSSMSSIEQWYQDDGIVDQIFNYYLNKGLGFVET